MRMSCSDESRRINWWAAKCASISARAERAVARVGAALGVDTVKAAAAILRVANSNMERAIRAVSVERGEDPRDFPLVAFGGCGGLHACEIAAELGVKTVIVPRMAGALSALGMLLADRTRDYSIGALGASDYEARFRKLEKQARKDVRGATLERFADVRYAGQSYELTIPWPAATSIKSISASTAIRIAKRATQIVTLRVRATVRVEKPSLRSCSLSTKVRRVAAHLDRWKVARGRPVFTRTSTHRGLWIDDAHPRRLVDQAGRGSASILN